MTNINNIRILQWDKHNDEFKRIDKHLSLVGISLYRYIGTDPPKENSADIFLVHEGPWLYSIPSHLRKRCIIVPCVKLDSHAEMFKGAGFLHAICKTHTQLKIWNDEDSIVVPSICDEQEPAQLENQKEIISLIHEWKMRDGSSFHLAKQIPNLKMYGQGDEQLGHIRDVEALKTAKFLIHIKNIGYVCNAVIKAIAMGVPVITTESTIPYGYENLLIHNFNAIICPNVECINKACNMSDEEYTKLRNNCLSMRNKLTQPNKQTSDALVDMIQKLYNRYCLK